jgi:DMSO/TMAO reductase YedYZ molybdopterin-dependent catalytic subunit
MKATMRRRHVVSSALAAWLGIAYPPARAAEELIVSGDVKRPLALDAASLRAMPAATQTSYRSSREVAGQPTAATVVGGVRLFAVLEQAGLAERDRFDWRKAVVIASARDGYRVVFSWPELANTAAGAQAMVVYERDGAALDAQEGPLALHAPGDTRRGPRHVKWLNRLEVRILRD